LTYLDKLILPDMEKEYAVAHAKRYENGGYLDNGYPFSFFPYKELSEIDFDAVTILYGGNGSGKSTLLNVIANKLQLKRLSPFNDSEMFSLYVDACKYRLGLDEDGHSLRIPNGSLLITSDDVFEYMLAARTINEEISENTEEGKGKYAALKFGENIKFKSLENYEEFRLQVLSRKKSLSRRKFLHKFAGQEVRLNSNGETAFDFFNSRLKNDILCCLDEPENSLSPQKQLELKTLIENKSRYCGCQFVIATHSPFILSVANAKIYDLDTVPVSLKKWWDTENTKIYFDFFYENKDLFIKKN